LALTARFRNGLPLCAVFPRLIIKASRRFRSHAHCPEVNDQVQLNPKKFPSLIIPALFAVFASSLLVGVSPPTHAYGKDNWQVAFSGTGVTPQGVSFGFWGWCAYVGVYSGSQGDCEMSQYVHAPGYSLTCEVSLDVTSWTGGFQPDHFITGTATVHPASSTDACVSIFPGSVSFTAADTQVPLIPGHYNIKNAFGALGTLQIQVTFIS
jgi:hypothetical protein